MSNGNDHNNSIRHAPLSCLLPEGDWEKDKGGWGQSIEQKSEGKAAQVNIPWR